MKIFSSDKNSYLSISENDSEFDVEGTFSISVKVDIGHSKFAATNSEIIFLNGPEFKAALDRFVTNRKLSPRLNGTYDTFLEFFGSANSVWLKFNIGSTFCGGKNLNYGTCGEFEISQDYLVSFIESLSF